MQVQAVVFDLDGTLVDSRADIVAACSHMLAEHGYEPRTEAEITSYVGDGARQLVARAVDLAPDDDRIEPLLRTYLDYYATHGHDQTTLLPDVPAVLAALGYLPLALCTHKPRATTAPLLDHLGLSRCFATTIAGGDVARHKPDPEPLLEIARRLELAPTALVMVGDGPQDIEAGRAAGARTVGIPGCFMPRARIVAAGPDALLDSIAQLPLLIARWSR